MAIPLDLALAALQIIPAVIGIVQGRDSAAVLGVVVAVRLKERLAATLIITGSGLLALHALRVIGD